MTHNQSNKLSNIIDKLEATSGELINFLQYEDLEHVEKEFIEASFKKVKNAIGYLYATMDE